MEEEKKTVEYLFLIKFNHRAVQRENSSSASSFWLLMMVVYTFQSLYSLSLLFIFHAFKFPFHHHLGLSLSLLYLRIIQQRAANNFTDEFGEENWLRRQFLLPFFFCLFGSLSALCVHLHRQNLRWLIVSSFLSSLFYFHFLGRNLKKKEMLQMSKQGENFFSLHHAWRDNLSWLVCFWIYIFI